MTLVLRIGMAFLMTILVHRSAQGEEALVLHLPFDGSLGNAAQAREVDFQPGRFGQAAHVRFTSQAAGTLSYDLSKLIDPRKGTLAFWVKTAADFGPQRAFGRLADIRSEETGYYNIWLRISVKGKGDFTFEIFDSDAKPHGFDYAEGLKTWKANEWHHAAIVWHCLKGVRVYDNGREVFSSWGKDKWEPQTPTLLGFGCIPGQLAQSELWFDEARLYTEPLEAAQVAALARGEDVRLEKKAEQFTGILSGNPGEKLRAEVEGQQGLPEITLGRPLTVRQLLVKSANVHKVTQGALYDGRLRGDPPVAGPVEVQFVGRSRITHLSFDGPNTAARLGTVSIPEGRNARFAMASPIEVERTQLEADRGGPSLNELRFYEVGEGWLGDKGERMSVAETEGPQVTIAGPAATGDMPIAAISLDLRLAPPWPSLVRMELTETAERNRSLFYADAHLRGQGEMRVTLDWPDYVLREGSQVIATITFDKPARVAEGSALVIHKTSLEAARKEYVTRQLGWFAPWYSYHAEAHAWDSRDWSPASMPELRWLDNVRRVWPDHPLATAYYNRIFHQMREVEVSIPGPAQMPLWARAQREAMRRTAEVVHWWIDNRQTEDGQFGGGWNDDVEMLHGWDLLVLGAGDEKVRQSMGRLCEGIWTPERFTLGYSNQMWDVEHAAEDSTYSQPRMVTLDYGNPKWLERCMETTANFDFWTEINSKGHRHFKGYMFQAQKLRPDPETDSDVPDNARAAKVGLSVLWYNGNERVKRWFREWADAWCEDSLRPVPGKPTGVLPGEIVAKTCQVGRDGSSWNRCKRYDLGALTYHMEDQLVGAYLFTGDRKYLAPVEAQVANNRAGEAAIVNWRRLCGDSRLDQRFIEQANKGAITPSFNAWLATGDKSHLAKACTEVVREFERNRYLITEAEPPTDRVPLPGNVLLRQMMLGGIGVWVCGWPQMAVTWEKTGYDFAALVLDAKPMQLKVLACNFGPKRQVVMRAWELERGTYQLRMGTDRNQDDTMDTPKIVRQIQVDRATPVSIELLPNELTVIELRQITGRPAGKRPDLAISAEDVKLSEDRKTLTVTVHNIGAAPTEDVTIKVLAKDGTELGRGHIERLLPPDDLVPKTSEVTIPLNRPAPKEWRVLVDPGGRLDEITKANNHWESPS